MDIKQLKYLIALDQTRHFGQAAAACHITQPTLSMRIRNLEDELNLTLIQRGQRFEGFTPEGERILAWARRCWRRTMAWRLKRRFVAARWWASYA
ncbi:Transcriptional regulator, LysR family [Klebsiella aerogenes]|nr:Transcriptional regulator, LysR family [Klebsiella aerogenes]